jgi:hypothetical protein
MAKRSYPAGSLATKRSEEDGLEEEREKKTESGDCIVCPRVDVDL